MQHLVDGHEYDSPQRIKQYGNEYRRLVSVLDVLNGLCIIEPKCNLCHLGI